jgi:hypothetical protein
MTVYAWDRENASIKDWDGERLVLRGGESTLSSPRCLVCGRTEQVEARARTFTQTLNSRLQHGLLLLFVLPPFGILLGLAVAISAIRRVRITFPQCEGCVLRGLLVKALGWGLALTGIVACPALGFAIAKMVRPESAPTALGGVAAGLIAYLCLTSLWQTIVVRRAAVTCEHFDDFRVVLRVPCQSAVEDMVDRVNEDAVAIARAGWTELV